MLQRRMVAALVWLTVATAALNLKKETVYETVYVGGDFSRVGTVATDKVSFYVASSRGVSASAWKQLDGGVYGGPVNSVAICGQDVVMGGSFERAGSREVVESGPLAAWLPAEQRWEGYGESGVAGWNGRVAVVRCMPGEEDEKTNSHRAGILVGGSFTKAGGAAVNHIARFDPGTEEFVELGSGLSGSVYDIVTTDATPLRFFVGGRFDVTTDGTTSQNVAVYETRSGVTGFFGLGTGVDGVVNALVATEKYLYAGGSFTKFGSGLPVNYMACWDRTGGAWSEVSGGFNDVVLGLAVNGAEDTLYAVGRFTYASSTVHTRRVAMLRIDKSDATWAPLDTGLDNTAYAVSVATAGFGNEGEGDVVFVAGEFKHAGILDVNNVAKFIVSTSSWSAIGTAYANSDFDSTVRTIVIGQQAVTVPVHLIIIVSSLFAVLIVCSCCVYHTNSLYLSWQEKRLIASALQCGSESDGPPANTTTGASVTSMDGAVDNYIEELQNAEITTLYSFRKSCVMSHPDPTRSHISEYRQTMRLRPSLYPREPATPRSPVNPADADQSGLTSFFN